MNAIATKLSESRRTFFTFVIKRFLMGSTISFVFAGLLMYSDIGGLYTMMSRSADGWMWMAFFTFDIWVTVTGITIAIGFWRLGDMRDPPHEEK